MNQICILRPQDPEIAFAVENVDRCISPTPEIHQVPAALRTAGHTPMAEKPGPKKKKEKKAQPPPRLTLQVVDIQKNYLVSQCHFL